MATTNFNLTYENGALVYHDAKGNTVQLGASAIIAPEYDATKTYAADSFVTHGGDLYTNENAIGTAEPWTAAHWTKTTVAELITALSEA